MTLTSDASRDKIDERFDGWTGLAGRSVLSLRDQCTRTSVTHPIQSRKAKARLFQWSAGYGSPFAMWSGWKSPLNVMPARAGRLAHAVRSIRPSSCLTPRPPTIITIDLLTDMGDPFRLKGITQIKVPVRPSSIQPNRLNQSKPTAQSRTNYSFR